MMGSRERAREASAPFAWTDALRRLGAGSVAGRTAPTRCASSRRGTGKLLWTRWAPRPALRGVAFPARVATIMNTSEQRTQRPGGCRFPTRTPPHAPPLCSTIFCAHLNPTVESKANTVGPMASSLQDLIGSHSATRAVRSPSRRTMRRRRSHTTRCPARALSNGSPSRERRRALRG